MKLIGSKVAIRSIEKKDLHTAIRWWNDSETMYLADDNPHPHKTLEELEEEFAKEKSEWSEYMERFVIETIDSHLIGDVLFYNYRRDTNNVFFGIFIGEKPYLGKGYGADAIKLSLEYLFEYRRVHKVELTVSDFNTRAIKVFEKSGFRRDGVLRDNAVVEGKYVDHILMSILDTEYFKLHDNPL
jgi:RimJ/RimL family protein N-acetyltransferase